MGRQLYPYSVWPFSVVVLSHIDPIDIFGHFEFPQHNPKSYRIFFAFFFLIPRRDMIIWSSVVKRTNFIVCEIETGLVVDLLGLPS